MLCLPGFGTHANTQNVPHFRAFPASIWEHSPPKCLFSWQALNCQIVPVLPSHLYTGLKKPRDILGGGENSSRNLRGSRYWCTQILWEVGVAPNSAETQKIEVTQQ